MLLNKEDIMRNDFLAHHGILGQKWGIRRYQNEDGSLTEAGKKRYDRLQSIADKKSARLAKYEAQNLKYAEKLRKHYQNKADKIAQKLIGKGEHTSKRLLKKMGKYQIEADRFDFKKVGQDAINQQMAMIRQQQFTQQAIQNNQLQMQWHNQQFMHTVHQNQMTLHVMQMNHMF